MKLMSLIIVFAVVGCSTQPASHVVSTGDEALPFERDTTPPLAVFESDEYLVADAVLRCILTSPEVETSRDFYGTPGSNEICLQGKWPACDFPSTAGYKIHIGHVRNQDAEQDRILCLQIGDLTMKPVVDGEQPTAEVSVSLFNAGGSRNGGVIGGCLAIFKVRRTDQGWVAEVFSLFDP